MTKRAPLLPVRHLVWFSWKLVITLSVLLCLFALLRLHFLSDSDLFSSSLSRPSRISSFNFTGRPKIAFLFLVRRNLPLDFLWASFFENGDLSDFSIFIHSAPGFVFDEVTTRSRFFFGRQLRNSIQVAWGESSMIAAERLLLDAALEDPGNQRFILLSDSCVPLYNFSYIYNYVMTTPSSFVDSFLDEKEERYNPKMSPTIHKKYWRKGSQWFTLIRSHAEVIVDDEVVFPLFRKFCKICAFYPIAYRAYLAALYLQRRPPVDAKRGNMNLKLQEQHNCIPDEHYVQTLLALSELEGRVERRTLTYTLWNESVAKMENKGWHPITFSYANAGPHRIKAIKAINHIYYETELRTEWCRSNSTLAPCFLFARKFSKGAAMRLLSEGVVGQFDTSQLLDPPP